LQSESFTGFINFYPPNQKQKDMKQLTIFLPLLLLACHTPAPSNASATRTEATKSTTTESPIKKIIFNTGSRGYQKAITLSKDSVLIVINSSFSEHPSKNLSSKITTTEWNKLTNSLNGVEIKNLNELKSPTMGRAVDAANHSSIAVTTDNEYVHSFDNTNPNEQLQKLMAVITEIENSRTNETK
jgi:hypothetical protein